MFINTRFRIRDEITSTVHTHFYLFYNRLGGGHRDTTQVVEGTSLAPVFHRRHSFRFSLGFSVATNRIDMTRKVPVGSHTVYLLLIAGNKCPFTKYSNDFLSYLGAQRNPRPLFSDIPWPLRAEYLYCGLVQGPSFDWMQYFRVPMLWGSC